MKGFRSIQPEAGESAARSITEYLDQELKVSLTRRELYWLRDQNRKRLDAAAQGMNAPAASPAKRSARWHEFEFHRRLRDHLHGVWLSDEEQAEERDELLVAQAVELERQAEELAVRATELRNRTGLTATAPAAL